MNCFSSIAMLVTVLSLVVFFHLEGTEAKRVQIRSRHVKGKGNNNKYIRSGGCASFGHSCYGGMGKRALELIDTNEEVAQDEQNPAFVFTGPRSSYPSRSYHKITPEQYDNISKIVRQWIQSYRRAQELQDNNNSNNNNV